MMDFHGKGAAFSRQLMADVSEQIRKAVSGVSATFATQKDGAVVSDQHRVLNFQGSGVRVFDDPSSRRTNILIAGAATTATATQLVISTVSAKAFSLWNGSSNNAPPSGWQNLSFNDAAWANAVTGTPDPTSVTTISGATQLWSTWTPAAISEQTLFRQTFTAPPGTYGSVSVTIEGDNDIGAAYLNGTLIGSALGSPGFYLGRLTASPSPSLIVPGGTNVLAVQGVNRDPTVVKPGSAWVSYLMNSSVVTVAPAFTNTASTFLSSPVTMTTANTYYDGPSVSLTAGTWLVMAAVDCLSAGPGGTEVAAKLWNGTTVYATAETLAAVSGSASTTVVSALITLASTTTVKVSAACQIAGCTLRSSLVINGAGNNCTYILALQLS